MHAERMGNIGSAKTGAEGLPAGREATSPVEQLRFDLLRSALYHDQRQQALARWHKALMFLSILLGSSAIAAFGSQYPHVGQAAGLVVAIIGAAQLVFDFGGAARDHADLRRRFYALLSEAGPDCDVKVVTAQMTLAFADEPPIVPRVNRKAHNAAGTNMFGDDFTRA